MKTAYTSWMWVKPYEQDRDAFRTQFEQSLLELSYLGYHFVENWTFLKRYFAGNEVRELCEKYNLPLACLYANLEEGVEDIKESIRFATEAGASWMICASPNWPPDKGHDAPMDAAEVEREAKQLNELGMYARERGITLMHNPHSFTPVCRREETDRLMEWTDPDTVKLCVDIGHSAVVGVDAEALLRDYAQRVAYIHIKDLDPALAYRGRGMSWVPLGLGTLHLSQFVQTLRDIGFNGVVCAGLPLGCERINRFESARIARQYLRVLGL